MASLARIDCRECGGGARKSGRLKCGPCCGSGTRLVARIEPPADFAISAADFESQREHCPCYEGICINVDVDQCTHSRNNEPGAAACAADVCPILRPPRGIAAMGDLHVVALSGGKDSTAMALRLAEVEPRDYTYVCTPTGNELPVMFAHWRRLGEILGKPIIPVMGGTLGGLIDKQRALPNWRQRWCTRMLKIEPYGAWLLRQKATYSRIVSYVGLRADEMEREGGDYSMVPGVEVDFPLRRWRWGMPEVVCYNADRGIVIPDRTDCAVCFYQRLAEWYVLWRDFPTEYAEGEAWEASTGYTFRSPGRDTWPASMRELRAEFESGRVPRGITNDKIADMKCRVCRI